MSTIGQVKPDTAHKAANAVSSHSAARPSHPAFEWLRSERIVSLNLEVEEYRHRETGALHYHLASEHPENVFLVAFRTVPMDSTGVAHILEHTALCGSEKYPVRDPFFMMIRRSLNTFMNAFTSSDWTAYPFASKNRKDFFNLLDVYLDAAFFSRLHELDFAQEGHRLEFTEATDSSTPLQVKGVVYNEMKGAMSSTNSVLWHAITRYLYPTTTYHYNSGGDPREIPDLEYQQLQHFYKTHYHPSNAVFMTFGDIPATELQGKFDSLALSRFSRLDIDISVADEKRYLAPIRVEEFYNSEESGGDRTHIVLAWLLGKSIDLKELFEAQLLNAVLLDNSASPLLQVLETTDLGSSPSPMCGLEDSHREMSFMCGLEGCADDATQAVEQLILETLENIAREGVPREQVEAALHQLELHQREITGDSYPYGLQLILASLSTAVHRGDPIELLNIEPVLEQLRSEIRNPRFIPELIERLLLQNRHRLTLTLHPDPDLASRETAAERQQLETLKGQLSPEQVESIIQQSRALAERQEQEDDPEMLPKVGLQDIQQVIEQPRSVTSRLPISGSRVDFFGQGTNGICYQQAVMKVPALNDQLMPLLPLYTSCLTELGVGELDYAQVQTWQSRVSGGLNCFSNIRSTVNDEQQSDSFLVLSSKALQENHQAMTELMSRTLQDVRFDEDRRVREIIEQICDRKVSGITGHGHSLAMSLACSRLSPSAALSHRYAGLAGIRYLKDLRQQIKNPQQLRELLEGLAAIHQQVLSAPRQFLSIAESEHQQQVLDELARGWDALPAAGEFTSLQLPPTRHRLREAWTIPTQVNFCAKAYPTVPSGHPDHAPLTVLAGFLRNGFLHRAIREQGGAYGGGADQDANSASFRFYSYRDPRLDQTLQDFDRAVDWVLTADHQARQLEEAILGVIASMDKPSSPAGEAKRVYFNDLFGRDREFLTDLRQRILAVTVEDLKRVTETWLKNAEASIGVITSKGNLSGSSQEFREVSLTGEVPE
ncbi:MAG: insulinase family protein [Gammaproteobacteria bacterium]|nr:insulinase family protein [Pseudomonadales bacterium]MCP5346376.1 insulinase family protein [Pseudomonadales bacterium]